ncbi:hypothetical protein JCM3774_006634 [Rhodotorula dairenensis]
MPSADNPPSLLSRLSPAVPVPIQSRAADHGPHSSKIPFGSSPTSPPPTLPVGSPPFVGSPSRASRSPRKGNHFPRAAPGAAHIAPLPDNVLQKSQPIPVGRSTNSSRWASSPPPIASSSSPAARSPAKRTLNAQHPASSTSSRDVPGAVDISSPNRHHRTSGSSSPALGQLESMVSQMRTASVSPPSQLSAPPIQQPSQHGSPRKTPASPLLGSTRSPRSPSFLPKSPSSLRGMAMAANPPDLLLSQSPKSPAVSSSPGSHRDGTRTPKKPVLGGKSKWAVAGDDAPDEHASVADRRKQQQEQAPLDGGASKQTSKNGGETAKGAPRVPAAQQAQKVVAEAGSDDLSKTPTPSHPALFASRATRSPTVPADGAAPADEEEDAEADTDAAESVSGRRSSVSSSVGSDAPSQSNSSHINWADDDLDDELPTLDDWGIDTTTTTSTSYSPSEVAADARSSSGLSSPSVTGSSTPAAAAAAVLPPLGSRRHHPARAHRSPPAPTNAKLPAATAARAPIKPNGRLFASAARAAIGSADTPPHLLAARNSPGKAAPTPSLPPAVPPVERSWRDRAAGGGGGAAGAGHPSPVVFSRLSGMTGSPPPARKGGAAAATSSASPPPPSPVAAAAAAASPTAPSSNKSRKSKKGGKSRGAGGGGGNNKGASESATASTPKKLASKPTTGVPTSKWA